MRSKKPSPIIGYPYPELSPGVAGLVYGLGEVRRDLLSPYNGGASPPSTCLLCVRLRDTRLIEEGVVISGIEFAECEFGVEAVESTPDWPCGCS